MVDEGEKGWLFKLEVETETDKALEGLAEAGGYIESLKSSEGFKNPEGLKGGVSGICKAVYTGIRQQRF